jgi:uncharacterized membrane protein HdeD (DUF308 family)
VKTLTESAIGNSLSQSFWVCLLLGTILIVGGLIVLGDVGLASFISTILIGLVSIAAGLAEIIFAFWTKGRAGFVEPILLGVFYIVFGIALISQPATGALILTFVFGLALVGSGLVRIFLGLRYRSTGGWVLAMSGVLGMVAGLVILGGWPANGFWVIGTLLGIDLIIHGAAWPIIGWQAGAPR